VVHGSSLIDLAADLLREVMRFDAPADGVVSAFFRRHRRLGPRERRSLADTIYAVLRRRLLWEHLAQSGHGAIERRLVLLAWQGGEETARRAMDAQEAGWLARARAPEPAILSPALRHNLPEWIAAPLRSTLGADGFERLAESLLQQAPLDLRVNTSRTRREDLRSALAEAGIETEPTPYSPCGLRIVAGKPALETLPSFLRGEFEVQDEGSQLLALALGARRGELVVDFCAGAGGKTLALGAAMRNTGRLYAFDTSAHRLDALKARAARSGLDNVHAMAIAHERDERIGRLAGRIDRVLVDAPCSGLGTLRRNPDLKWRHTPQSIDEFAARQVAILGAAARLVKPGGRLFYATCSLLPAENEAIAEDFGRAHAEFVAVPAIGALASARVARADEFAQGACLKLSPERHGTDGFFAALWQRR
jgi:16S rRNA (cytosine967-C5)-methyltransferase